MNAIRNAARGRSGPARLSLGFSLIEVLVTLFILAFGLLGLATTQIHALHAQRRAEAEALAVRHAANMLERLRLDRRDALAGAFDSTCEGGGGGASGLRAWRRAVADTLPDGKGCVTVSGDTVLATARVEVQWRERGDAGNESRQSRHVSLSTRL
ncbi:type IV pilus modification protein PilV [Modicisalibacter tunisiensis]|uniref:Type IV pilus modification protein PilV n=1 Tax=Modicisalibacter tunisiensis TaxID=390637 RepID=A0ABS7WVF1_9GAMM|nr:type IV pilus modification protein PilV [Modicisalibacter tunisiensis]MBZ9566584.1 type IV pilus modification protein PilV [Modicisalibacter tunisiensis]